MQSGQLVQILQGSVSPVVLISGIGLLLLSMTNRLGRVVDRVRGLSRELRSASQSDGRKIRRQLRMLARRARLLRTAIMAASISILFVALLILALFAEFLLPISVGGLILLLFAMCIVSLIVSMVVFVDDLAVSLNALWTEIADQV
ncbi:MAG: DUF2721 domain-containing protein [Candidatus Sumerlaeia bacterium]|nr:DUF2721 domain-containing protein [Candidatus Sumerlaeia bacterium]